MVKKTSDCVDSDGDCNKANELVDKYIDGILEDTDRVFIQRHLDGCPGCKHGYDFESSFHIRVRSLKPICMPQDVKSQIMLALGFPGMTTPSPSTLSAMGAPDIGVSDEISSQMGIPRGDIPQGSIPTHDFFLKQGDLSSSDDNDQD